VTPSIPELADAYNGSAFAKKFPTSRLWSVKEQGRDVVYGIWLVGNDYRNKTKLYGSYPPGYLKRLDALFAPLQADGATLHAFSGSLPQATGRYIRLDLHAGRGADVTHDVTRVHELFPASFLLSLADPPYSSPDAEKYGTPMVNRLMAICSLAAVTRTGGYLGWLDTQWPMHRKAEWLTVGRIGIIVSTNKRVRFLHIFQRTAARASILDAPAVVASAGNGARRRRAPAGSATTSTRAQRRPSVRTARAGSGNRVLFE
jgi:hypothetical protein